jgi:hypothetical protein
MSELTIHPLAARFPEIPEKDFQALKEQAYREVRKAKSTGEITPGPCEVCGFPNVHGHHEDYARQLDLRWLCNGHHTQFHYRLRTGKVQSLNQYIQETKFHPSRLTEDQRVMIAAIEVLRISNASGVTE